MGSSGKCRMKHVVLRSLAAYGLVLIFLPGCSGGKGVNDANGAALVNFLIPDASQMLYTGSSYIFMAQAQGALNATVKDQSQTTLGCSYNPATGLISCAYVPSVAGTLTLTLTAALPDGTTQTASRQFTVSTPTGIYPLGDRFMYGFYSVSTNRFAAVQALSYVNASHEYCPACTANGRLNYINAAKASGLSAFASMDYDINGSASTPATNSCVTAPSVCTSAIDAMAPNANFLIWDIPEEMDYLISSQMNAMTTIAAYAHAHDPMKRPVYMYIASNYTAKDIQNYVPYLDIIGAGAYGIDNSQPSAWVRWRAEAEVNAIIAAGYTTQQKTPILVTEAFCSPRGCTAGANFIHDTFTGLAAGLKGIMVYGYEQMLSTAADTPAAAAKTINLVMGTEALGEWVVKGKSKGDLTVVITSGSLTTPFFTPDHGEPTQNFPSVRAAAFDWAGVRLVIAVNSSPLPVTAILSGLPTGVSFANVVNESRYAMITGGALTDSFDGLGVHIYKVPMVGQQSDGHWISLQ